MSTESSNVSMVSNRGSWLLVFNRGQKMVLKCSEDILEVKRAQRHLSIAIENGMEEKRQKSFVSASIALLAFWIVVVVAQKGENLSICSSGYKRSDGNSRPLEVLAFFTDRKYFQFCFIYDSFRLMIILDFCNVCTTVWAAFLAISLWKIMTRSSLILQNYM